ncbi:MAG: hypothetical protein EZS28_040319 [Streblomastix strix]|uniref:Uncharacterized protein n=1 Tax=Streblomastix strix TaxID=222440 RepID=A0A5J4U141_9EUKA|nr:MAG: hypothetical protein EZS28_040319 [Streblomastix strix]
MNELEIIIADGSDDNGDEDQSEHAIESMNFTNGNDGLRENDSGKQLEVTVNRETNPDINITKISANIQLHNASRLDGFGENSQRTLLQAETNEKGLSNHQAIDNIDNQNNNEQVNENTTDGNKNKYGPSNDDQHKQGTKHQDNRNTEFNELEHFTQPIPNKNQEIQTFHNPKTSHPQSSYLQNQIKLKEKLQDLNRVYNQPTTMISEAKHACESPSPISLQVFLNLEQISILLNTSYLSWIGEKRQMQPKLLKISQQNTLKARRPVHDLRNRNKDPTQRIRQRQCPTPKLIGRNNWTDQREKGEKRESRNFVNREINNDNEEILFKNGRTNSVILGILRNNQREILYLIMIQLPLERQSEYQQAITSVNDIEIQGNRRRCK